LAPCANAEIKNPQELIFLAFSLLGFSLSQQQLQQYVQQESDIQTHIIGFKQSTEDVLNFLATRSIPSTDLPTHYYQRTAVLEQKIVDGHHELRRTINEFKASASWRLTRPLRSISKLFRH
jgi:hypothetical protein